MRSTTETVGQCDGFYPVGGSCGFVCSLPDGHQGNHRSVHQHEWDSEGYLVCEHELCLTGKRREPVQDFVSLQDYQDAIRILSRVPDGDGLDWGGEYGSPKSAQEAGQLSIVGMQWREHAILNLNDKIDRTLRDTRIPRDQQQFMAMMKRMALGYKEDAQALDWAAARLLKCKGCGKSDLHGANETKKAALVAHRAAQELIGEDG